MANKLAAQLLDLSIKETRSSPLRTFLSSRRSALLHGPEGSTKPILVLGNPSADLDSFISAVVYAYFCNKSKHAGSPRTFLPLLNLPTIRSDNLWRERPEFGTALRLAIGHASRPQKLENGGDGSSADKQLLNNLVTIADIRSAHETPFRSLFSSKSSQDTPDKIEMILVDHNVPNVPTVSAEDFSNRIELTGCIDHHVDENTIPSEAQPRIIKTGIGSCTSLVVEYLREKDLWPKRGQSESDAEIARLALAPILIDTANLTTEGKVSVTDQQAVSFLESRIRSSLAQDTGENKPWDRQAFYDEIAAAKVNSLDLLTLPEILGRDYKEWAENDAAAEAALAKPLAFTGISSTVKPVTWLVEKAGGPEKLLDEIRTFSRERDDHVLSLFALLTASTSASGDFQRELLMIAFDTRADAALDRFVMQNTDHLQLEAWDEAPALSHLLTPDADAPSTRQRACIWWQRDVSKSRKEVAPLLRKVMAC